MAVLLQWHKQEQTTINGHCNVGNKVASFYDLSDPAHLSQCCWPIQPDYLSLLYFPQPANSPCLLSSYPSRRLLDPSYWSGLVIPDSVWRFETLTRPVQELASSNVGTCMQEDARRTTLFCSSAYICVITCHIAFYFFPLLPPFSVYSSRTVYSQIVSVILSYCYYLRPLDVWSYKDGVFTSFLFFVHKFKGILGDFYLWSVH